jgi:hypothetical protein
VLRVSTAGLHTDRVAARRGRGQRAGRAQMPRCHPRGDRGCLSRAQHDLAAAARRTGRHSEKGALLVGSAPFVSTWCSDLCSITLEFG